MPWDGINVHPLNEYLFVFFFHILILLWTHLSLFLKKKKMSVLNLLRLAFYYDSFDGCCTKYIDTSSIFFFISIAMFDFIKSYFASRRYVNKDQKFGYVFIKYVCFQTIKPTRFQTHQCEVNFLNPKCSLLSKLYKSNNFFASYFTFPVSIL